MKSGNHTASKAHSQMRRNVPLERPQPVILSLPGEPRGLIPKAAQDPVAEAFQDNANRRMMPGPVPERPHGVHGPTVRATPAPKFHEAVAAVEVSLHKPMAPNTSAAAAFAQTRPRTEKRIVPPESENLLDTHHEKKRQYAAPSPEAAEYHVGENAVLSASGRPFFFLKSAAILI